MPKLSPDGPAVVLMRDSYRAARSVLPLGSDGGAATLQGPTLLLRNVAIWRGTSFLTPPHDVIIEGTKIVNIARPGLSYPEGAATPHAEVDCAG
jgi:hypothetical protein